MIIQCLKCNTLIIDKSLLTNGICQKCIDNQQREEWLIKNFRMVKNQMIEGNKENESKLN